VAVRLTTSGASAGGRLVFLVSLGVAVLVVARHRGNISRLRRGDERKFSLRGG
jgi:glycerol-3-phosphate acyltransferase PlsY